MKKITFALTLFALLSLMLSACTAGLVQQPPADQQESTPTFVATNTLEPTLAPTEVVATPAPTEAPVVAAIPCETIMVSKDSGNTWVSAGLALDTESVYDIGNRVTWTSRSSLVDKAPDVALTDAELKLVEQTWLMVRYNACQTQPVLFTGGVKIDTLKFDKGALFLLPLGQHEISVRNGELVLWYDTQHQDKDLLRIIKEIRNGNFDISSRLGLAVTDSLKDKLPSDILDGVQIVLLP